MLVVRLGLVVHLAEQRNNPMRICIRSLKHSESVSRMIARVNPTYQYGSVILFGYVLAFWLR